MRMTFISIRYLSVSLVAALVAMPAHALYKCVDEKGITHYGDTMPPQCAKKAITEMSQQGSVLKQYDAPLTPEQLKAQGEERERRREHEKKLTEQRLQDNALVATYGSEREFDMARDKDLASLDARKRTLAARNDDVDKQLAKYENEMEFYKAGKSKASKTREPPQPLLHELQRLRIEKEGLEQSVAGTERQIEAFRVRFDIDKKRWLALKADPSARSTERK